MKLNFQIAPWQVPDALGIHKNDVLLPTHEEPENEIGMEVAGFKKTDTVTSAAIVAKF